VDGSVVDFRPFGGTCALRGCDPKKMLISGTSAVDDVRRMQPNGVAGHVHIDWPKLMAFKRAFTKPVPEMHERTYRAKAIDTFHGKAKFTGRNTVVVDGETVEAKHVLLACGAEPVKLNIPGEEHLRTHEDFLTLETLPGTHRAGGRRLCRRRVLAHRSVVGREGRGRAATACSRSSMRISLAG
jgi:glutathione reductase (NADPH)